MRLLTPSLLITDDDRDFRQTLCGLFESRGLRTLSAANGQEALEIVRSEPVHLILTDMHMPKLSGLETIRRIRQMRGLLPCILISGQLDELLEQEARQAAAYSVLHKPIQVRDVTNAVQQALLETYDWPGAL